MRWMLRGVPALLAVALMAGCTGLEQFPETSTDYSKSLGELDSEYQEALGDIYAGELDPKRTRNKFIEARMAVIDEQFHAFVRNLARENAGVDFGVALVGIGVGGAGALVTETASQILSAVSGGLAGAQAAYDKTVLYDQALSALIAQMRASRAAVAAEIFERWPDSIDAYPLWLARRDVEAYQFAGSLPGAILATAADAERKEREAIRIISDRVADRAAFSEQAVNDRASIMDMIDALSAAEAKELVTQMAPTTTGTRLMAAEHYPESVRTQDTTGTIAKQVLKRMVAMTGNTPEERGTWRNAINSIQ